MIWLLILAAACVYGYIRVIRWALREDRVERAEEDYEQSTWRDAESWLKELLTHSADEPED